MALPDASKDGPAKLPTVTRCMEGILLRVLFVCTFILSDVTLSGCFLCDIACLLKCFMFVEWCSVKIGCKSVRETKLIFQTGSFPLAKLSGIAAIRKACCCCTLVKYSY